MKKFIMGLIIGILSSLSLTALAVEYNILPNPFPVFVNGQQAQVEGLNINGYTYLKLADLKVTGLTVKFNETDKQIEITSAASSTAAPESTNINTGGNSMTTLIKGRALVELLGEKYPELAESIELNKEGKLIFGDKSYNLIIDSEGNVNAQPLIDAGILSAQDF